MTSRLVIFVWVLPAACCLAGLLCLQLDLHHRQSEGAKALFHGTASLAGMPLRGRLAGHPADLPTAATRCINCHSTDSKSGGGGLSRRASNAFGTPLNAATLAGRLPRRGGPPSRYDAASLCRVLRDGIDPAFVIVNQAMPRYEISDAQCAALWLWLVKPAGN